MVKEIPRGLCKTIAYTQLCEAIKKDFGIELPLKTGKEIPKAIEDILGVRATDPLLKEMVEALEEIVRCLSHGLQDCRASVTAKAMLQKYHDRVSE